MREHPVPQDITGYQFHIIGEMTIKQFAEVGAGVILGFIIYATNLPALLEWPLIVIAVATGAMAAFVPFEEQPLDHWIVTFFKTLYKPTQYYWKKDARLPESFRYTAPNPATLAAPQVDLNPARRQRIKEYLVSLPQEEAVDEYTFTQTQRVQNILSTFESIPTTYVATTTNGTDTTTLPNLTLRPHSLRTPTYQDQVDAQVDTIPAETRTSLTMPTVAEGAEVLEQDVVNPELIAQTGGGGASQSTQQQNDVIVPQNQPIAIPTRQEEPQQETAVMEEAITYSQPSSYIAPSADQNIDTSQMQSVVNNVELPFPALPTEPNKVVGMTLSGQNDLLHEVIIEIKTPTGQVVRAVKSNSLGQFFISTPLRNGTYIVTAEKEGYQFPDQQLILNGAVIHPLEIRSA